MDKLIKKLVSEEMKEYLKKYKKEIMFGAIALSGLIICILLAVAIVKIVSRSGDEAFDGDEEDLEDDDFFDEEA